MVIPVMTQHCAMLQRNLLYTGARGLWFWLGRRRPSPSRCATSRAHGVVEAGGRAERGCLEALRECMMSGVPLPLWRSQFYLASSKVRDKSIASFQASTRRSAIPPIADVSLRGSEPPLRTRKRHLRPIRGWSFAISHFRSFQILLGPAKALTDFGA